MKIATAATRRTGRRGRLLVVTFAAAVVALASVAGVAAAKKPRALYWGATIGPQLTGTAAPYDMNAVSEFEQMTGKGISVLSFSMPFADCGSGTCSFFPFPTPVMESLREHGTFPLLSWASQSVPSTLNEPDYRLSNVINGTYDSYIREFAKKAADWKRPFFLRFNPEMNGFWFPWSEGVNGNKAGEFVAAWRHVHDIFEDVGATNATWVWCPNVDFENRLTPLARLYPGNKYVNWTCLDGFNWGATKNSAGWMTFNQIYRSTYRQIAKIAPSKPMMVGEVASDNRGGSKPAWIENMLRVIPAEYPKVRAVLWYDELDQNMHWPLAGSSAKAFARGISRNLYRPNVFSEPPPGPIRPPGPR